MLAIDIPISLLAGLALAESGKNMLKGNDPHQHYFMKSIVLLFAVFFLTPVPFYFFLGWLAWEVNFLWQWQDKNLPIHPWAYIFWFLNGKKLAQKG